MLRLPGRTPVFGALLSVVPLVLLAPVAVEAGVFGGFSPDGGEYLRGGNQICTAVSPGAAPSCRRAATEEIARIKFDRGQREGASDSRYAVSARGTKLVVSRRATGDEVATHTTPDAVERVSAVYANRAGDRVAIEFETRLGRKLVEEVVVLIVDVPDGAAERKPQAPAGDSTPEQKRPEIDEGARAKALDKAERFVRRKKWAEAAAAFEAVFAISPDDPEARFGLAAVRALSGEPDAAIEELEKLGTSTHPDAPIWRVEARKHKAFKKLRTDERYRRAVGIEPDPNRILSAYERLMGFGGHWEQSPIPCEEPQINLKLIRTKRLRFSLKIRSKCQGMRETTSLDGTWRASGTTELVLVFPNPGQDDEEMQCRIELCTDGSREDCLRCAPGSDMEMLLRVVRR